MQRDVVAVDSIELARDLARRDGRLLFGEVGGDPPPGFDHGNSPVEASTALVDGRSAWCGTRRRKEFITAAGIEIEGGRQCPDGVGLRPPPFAALERADGVHRQPGDGGQLLLCEASRFAQRPELGAKRAVRHA